MIWVEKYLRDHLVPSPSFDCALRKKKCKWLHGALKKDETGTKRKKKTIELSSSQVRNFREKQNLGEQVWMFCAGASLSHLSRSQAPDLEKHCD